MASELGRGRSVVSGKKKKEAGDFLLLLLTSWEINQTLGLLSPLERLLFSPP